MTPPIHKNNLPILVLCFSQAVGVATNTHIYPFIASLMLSKGVKPDQVSTYAAIAESAMSISFLFCLRLHVWGVGRFSHKKLQMFVIRGLTGVVAIGSVLNIVVLGDLVEEETKERSYFWFTAGSYFGFMSGAAFSGYSAEPYGRVPLFGRMGILDRYPYALPGFVILGCSILSSLGVAFLVPETSSKDRPGKHTDEQESEPEPTVTYKGLITSSSFRQIAGYHLVSRMCYFGSLGLLTSAGKLPNSMGGLDMSIPEIGDLLFITQLLVALGLVFVSGRITKALSLRSIAMISSIGFVALAAYIPVASHLKAVHFPVSWLPKLLWLAGQVVGELWIPGSKQGVTLLRLYPLPRDRAFAVGAIKQIAIGAGAVGTAGYGTMFGISSSLPAGTLGREAVWILTCGVALVGTAIEYAQPVFIDKPKHYEELPTTESEPDERSRLLPPVAVEV